MDGRKIVLCCALGMAVVLITGCSDLNSQSKLISSDEAKTLALADAGIPANTVERTTSTLSRQNDLDYYEVNFTVDGMEYQYDIDAMTGTVIESRTSAAQRGQDVLESFDGSANPAESDAGRDSSASQGTVAGRDSGTDAGRDSSTARDTANGRKAPSDAAGNNLITEEDAKKKALDHDGFSADQVTFSKCKLDWEDGRQVYEIEFYAGNNEEYSYDIDAKTGAVISSDYESKDPIRLPTGGANENMISADRAKEIALNEVSGAKNSDILEFKTDYDDGRLEYEGKIIYNDMEYEFEIDGYSGAIRSWEVESIYH